MIDLGDGDCLRDPVAAGEMDECGGHSGRANDYHYHQLTDHPGCLLDTLDDNAIVGVMLDGLPVFAAPLTGSTAAHDCGGYIAPDGTYHYGVTADYPYITNCLIGAYDPNDQPSTPGTDAAVGPYPDGSITDYYVDGNGCHVLTFSNNEIRTEFCPDLDIISNYHTHEDGTGHSHD